MPLIDVMPQYLEWANTRALGMARAAGTSDAQKIMAHILGAETTWGSWALGLPPCNPWPEWSLDECALRIGQAAALYRRIADEVAADAIVSGVTTKGVAFEMPLQETLLHVFAHGAYHRGQISIEARRAGQEVVDTDFVIFLRRQ